MSYMMIWHDRSVRQVTDVVARCYFNRKPVDTSIIIGESGYQLSSIAGCLSMTEYYQQYPDARPDSSPVVSVEPKRPFSEEEHKIAMRGVLLGLYECILEREARGESTDHARAIYEKARKKGSQDVSVSQLSGAALGRG